MTKPRRSASKDLDDLEVYLKTHVVPVTALPHQEALTHVKYDEAVRAYLESWRK